MTKEEAVIAIQKLPTLWSEEPVRTLVEARVLYTRARCRLHLYAELRGILLGEGEGYVMRNRVGRFGGKLTTSDQRAARPLFIDAVHMPGSTHYGGHGGDELVWRELPLGREVEIATGPEPQPRAKKFEYVSDGADQVYAELGEFWESIHPLCRWGGRFGDADHFSIEWGGVK